MTYHCLLQTVNQTIMELYCKYAGAVWVDWDYNTIRAGTGLFPGQNQLIAKFLGEGMGEVNAVGFASEGTAMWDFHPDAGKHRIGFRSRFSQCVDYMRFNEK